MKKAKTDDNLFSLEAKDFYSDFSSQGMLYASLIRSPASTGTVSKVIIPNLPEDYYFFTANDIPGNNKIDINGTSVQVFTKGAVSFPGEVLGIVCGPDKKKVAELAQDAEISFDINSLESAFQSIEKKYKLPAIKISKGRGGSDFSNLVNELNELPSLDTVQSAKKAERLADVRLLAEREVKTGLYKGHSIEEAEKELFTEDIKVFEGTWSLSQVDSLWQESNGAFCTMEDDILHVYTPTKWSYLLLDILTQTLGVKADRVFIHKTKTSGMFSNGIWKNAVLASQVATASFLTRKPVKLVYTQEEQDVYMRPGVSSDITFKTGITSEGRINSMNITINVNAGATNPFSQEIIDRMAIACTGIYQTENLYIHAKAESSSTPPTSVYPKIIDAQSFFAIENHVQQIIQEMHLLPDEFRLLNSQGKSKTFPFSVQPGNEKETLLKVISESDFNRKFISFTINSKNHASRKNMSFFALPLRGIGLSCAYDGSGYYGRTIYSCDQKMELTLTEEGILEIHTIKPSAVVENIWKKTAGDILGLEASKIKINAEFPLSEIPNIPEETSSNISVMTYLLTKCCQDIKKKREREPLPLKSKKQISPSMKSKWNNSTFSGSPFHSASFASAVVEVEIDPYTYQEKIKGLWMTVSCGKLFDTKAAERSIKLSIQQELSSLVRNAKVECEEIRIFFIPSEDSPGQIGELVHNTIPAAFSSALSLALSTKISTLPVSQNLLYSLMKQRDAETETEKKTEETNEDSDNA